jgi:cobalt/nickel transport system permease protein
VGAGHGHGLHFDRQSLVHRLPAHVKIVAVLAFVVVVVATPNRLAWAFAGYAVLVLAAAGFTRVPAGHFARRMVVEVPFVLFALLMPFVARGPRVDIGPFSVSEHGLVGAFGLLTKATIGVVAALTLATTTEPRDVVAGLERLRLPRQLVEIMGFMVRYLEVVTGDLRRMKVARESRGFTARTVRSWPVLASSAGALFIKSYERGERVHLAMLSRGYQGHLPVTRRLPATASDWRVAAVLPVGAVLVLGAGSLATAVLA